MVFEVSTRTRRHILIASILFLVVGIAMLIYDVYGRTTRSEVLLETPAPQAYDTSSANVDLRVRLGGGFRLSDASHYRVGDTYARAAVWFEPFDDSSARVIRKPSGTNLPTPNSIALDYAPSGDKLYTWDAERIVLESSESNKSLCGFNATHGVFLWNVSDTSSEPTSLTENTYTFACIYKQLEEGGVAVQSVEDEEFGAAVLAAETVVAVEDDEGSTLGLYRARPNNFESGHELLVLMAQTDECEHAYLFRVPVAVVGQTRMVTARYVPMASPDTGVNVHAWLDGVRYSPFAVYESGSDTAQPTFTGHAIALRSAPTKYAVGPLYVGGDLALHLCDQESATSRAHWVNHYMNPVVVFPNGDGAEAPRYKGENQLDATFVRSGPLSESLRWVFASHLHDPTIALSGTTIASDSDGIVFPAGGGVVDITLSVGAANKLPYVRRIENFSIGLQQTASTPSLGYPSLATLLTHANKTASVRPSISWDVRRDPAWLNALERKWTITTLNAAGLSHTAIDPLTGSLEVIVEDPAAAADAELVVALSLDDTVHLTQNVILTESRQVYTVESAPRIVATGGIPCVSRIHLLPDVSSVELRISRGSLGWAKALVTVSGGTKLNVFPNDTFSVARGTTRVEAALYDELDEYMGQATSVELRWMSDTPAPPVYSGNTYDVEVGHSMALGGLHKVQHANYEHEYRDAYAVYMVPSLVAPAVDLHQLGFTVNKKSGAIEGRAHRAPYGFKLARSVIVFGPAPGEVVLSAHNQRQQSSVVTDIVVRVTRLRPFKYNSTNRTSVARPIGILPGVQFRIVSPTDGSYYIDTVTGLIQPNSGVTRAQGSAEVVVGVVGDAARLIDPNFVQRVTLNTEHNTNDLSSLEQDTASAIIGTIGSSCIHTISSNSAGFGTLEVTVIARKSSNDVGTPDLCYGSTLGAYYSTNPEYNNDKYGIDMFTVTQFAPNACKHIIDNKEGASIPPTAFSMKDIAMPPMGNTKNDVFRGGDIEYDAAIKSDAGIQTECRSTTKHTDMLYTPGAKLSEYETRLNMVDNSVSSMIVDRGLLMEMVEEAQALVTQVDTSAVYTDETRALAVALAEIVEGYVVDIGVLDLFIAVCQAHMSDVRDQITLYNIEGGEFQSYAGRIAPIIAALDSVESYTALTKGMSIEDADKDATLQALSGAYRSAITEAYDYATTNGFPSPAQYPGFDKGGIAAAPHSLAWAAIVNASSSAAYASESLTLLQSNAISMEDARIALQDAVDNTPLPVTRQVKVVLTKPSPDTIEDNVDYYVVTCQDTWSVKYDVSSSVLVTLKRMDEQYNLVPVTNLDGLDILVQVVEDAVTNGTVSTNNLSITYTPTTSSCMRPGNMTITVQSGEGSSVSMTVRVDVVAMLQYGATHMTYVITPVTIRPTAFLTSSFTSTFPNPVSITGATSDTLLPNGLALSSNGVVYGVPTTVGEYVVGIEANFNSVVDSVTYTGSYIGTVTIVVNASETPASTPASTPMSTPTPTPVGDDDDLHKHLIEPDEYSVGGIGAAGIACIVVGSIGCASTIFI